MPHHSGKCFVYWKWPNQSYFSGMLCQWVLYNTTLALWKGQKQTHPWYTLHFTWTSRSFKVPSFLQQQCWVCPKVRLSHGGSSLWATSAGNIQPFPAQQLWVMQHKYWNIRSHSQSTREDWTPVLSITHRSSYLNKFQEIPIFPSSSWHWKQNI